MRFCFESQTEVKRAFLFELLDDAIVTAALVFAEYQSFYWQSLQIQVTLQNRYEEPLHSTALRLASSWTAPGVTRQRAEVHCDVATLQSETHAYAGGHACVAFADVEDEKAERESCQGTMKWMQARVAALPVKLPADRPSRRPAAAVAD